MKMVYFIKKRNRLQCSKKNKATLCNCPDSQRHKHLTGVLVTIGYEIKKKSF